MPSIRKANLDDAKSLATLGERTFRDSFGALNTVDDMELYCQANFGEIIQAGEISDPNLDTLLAEEAGRLVGYAQLRWDGAPACILAQAPGEIQRFYVISDWQGKGLAQDLMSACLEELKRRGSDVAWLGVWERNPRAIRFYKKFGFVEAGEHRFTLGRDPQRDIVMARALSG